MATTTNYGWTTPNDTDLVKDGAAAIRTLGSSVDTTTKNLNPQTTTGALAYRSATANVNTALPIGTAGQVLTVNSGATAPEWVTATGAMTLLSTTALTSAATFTVSSISGSYTDLKVVASGISLASTDQVLLRFNGITSSSYFYAELQVEDGTAYPATNTGQTNIQVSHMISTSDYDKTGSFEFIIPRYAAAEQHTFFMSSKGRFSTANKFFTKICRVDTASAINSITIFTVSSTNFSAGNLYIYGVK
jgi:hypothetical protein